MSEPGSLELNEFELALLNEVAKTEPDVAPLISSLHVLSREYTGVGSFTNFHCSTEEKVLGNKVLSPSNLLINIPTLENGLGVLVICKGGKLDCLETFTYGTEHWGGNYVGYSFTYGT